MRQLEYIVSFNTPAFLGNAEQQAQWRTPPFKALIRQWWRIVKAPGVGYDIIGLREQETRLFGSASDKAGSRSAKSRIIFRLSDWKQGQMNQWQAGERVYHPEVGKGGMEVGADLYLGYGPLGFEKGKGTTLGTVRGTGVQRTAIKPSTERSRLIVRIPEEDLAELQRTMQLVAYFGTLGSRSRNGWGSLEVQWPENGGALLPLRRSNLERCNVCRPLTECLNLEWPHAIGTDAQGPLVWKTKIQSSDWRAIMKELARIKIQFRTQFGFGGPGSSASKRHILAYPITNHSLTGWGQQGRLANQLRFKVGRHADGRLEGVIFHLPCKVPDELLNKLLQADQQFIRNNELAVWQAVHKVLDREATRLT
jgi:CRISPR-associated protein Cmr1